jgi:hypothetical protein
VEFNTNYASYTSAGAKALNKELKMYDFLD